MTRTRTVLLTAGLLACTSATGPSQLYPSYFLSQVDGSFLPVPYGQDGTVLKASHLGFPDGGRPRDGATAQGLVRYTLITQQPGQPEQRSDIDLEFEIRNGILTINLCPPLALCITTTELRGPAGKLAGELALTHYVGGVAGSVYRYQPVLLD